jgi:hypothetical protein
LQKLHGGIARGHLSFDTTLRKILDVGYWWLTMNRDVHKYCCIYSNIDIKVLAIVKHLDHIAIQKVENWPSKPELLKVGHVIPYLHNSMTIDLLLSTLRVVKCGGNNRNKYWKKM